MKRTNLVLDESLLGEALKVSGQPTYSAAVNEALEEFCRLRRLKEIYKLKGSGIWEGDLGDMRGDYESTKAPRSPNLKDSQKQSKKSSAAAARQKKAR